MIGGDVDLDLVRSPTVKPREFWGEWETPLWGPTRLKIDAPDMGPVYRQVDKEAREERRRQRKEYRDVRRQLETHKQRSDRLDRAPSDFDLEDHEERAAVPGRWKFAFWSRLGEPPTCPPGSVGREMARRFLERLETVRDERDEEGVSPWTASEQNYLNKLIQVWGRRARGEDPRFDRLGNRRGREKGR